MALVMAGGATASSLPLLPRCGSCGIYKTCRSPKMPVRGEGRRKILIVGEAPGQQEDMQGRPFVGKTGRYLRNDLKALGVDTDKDVWLTNSLICRPPSNVIPKETCIDDCRPNVVKAVRELQPNVVVLLGKQAVRSLIGWLWKEDVGSVYRWAGWTIPAQRINSWVCVSYHPSHLLREDNPVMHRDFTAHLRAAVALADAPPWPAGPPDYKAAVQLVWRDDEAVALLQRFAAGTSPVSFDFETTTLKPDGDDARIVCCGVSDGKETGAFMWTPAAAAAFKAFARSPVPKVGWNSKFESRWCIKHLGCEVRNWQWDGMIAAHVLDNRRQVSGLKFQAFVRLGQEDYDSAVKPYLKSKDEGGNAANRITQVDPSKLLEYCGLDALLEWEVARHQRAELRRLREAEAAIE